MLVFSEVSNPGLILSRPGRRASGISRVSPKILQAKALVRFSPHRAMDNLASWADPTFSGNHGIAESVNLAIDF